MALLLMVTGPNYLRAQTLEEEWENPNPPQLMANALRHGVPQPPPAVPESINLTKSLSENSCSSVSDPSTSKM